MSIRSDVDRGIEIVVQMEALKNELKEIEARLEKAGLHGQQVDLEDAEREGKQFLAAGSEKIVPVVFTADLIRKSFLAQSAVHRQVALAIDAKRLPEFYVPKTTFEAVFEEGKQFRRRAAEVLGDAAPAFVTACLARDKQGIPKSQIKVEWDRATAKESEVPA